MGRDCVIVYADTAISSRCCRGLSMKYVLVIPYRSTSYGVIDAHAISVACAKIQRVCAFAFINTAHETSLRVPGGSFNHSKAA